MPMCNLLIYSSTGEEVYCMHDIHIDFYNYSANPFSPWIVVGIPEPVPLPIGEPLVVAVLGVVAVLRHPLAVVVVLGQVAGVLVARVREAGVVLGVVLAGDAVEAGVVAVPVPVLGGNSIG